MHVPGIVGISAGIRGVEDEIVRTRDADANVLITGEDGVGKSLVARLIHDRSPRAAGPFVAASCASLHEQVLEGRLFGAEYGTACIPGCDGDGSWLEAANGGTLFIDAVDKVGTRAQSALLRFLESGRQQRVPPDRRPDRRKPALDVRLITATRRSLFDAVMDGRFLEHLYYRLNVVHIQIPALRERREDVPALMEHFLRFFAGVHERAVPEPDVDAQAVLMAYSWPGNVAELRAVAEWLVLQGMPLIDAAALPATVRSAGPSVRDAPGPALPRSMHEEVFARIRKGADTFWTAVYAPFAKGDLTRTDVRAIVWLGVESGGGSFKALAERLRVKPRDYKRLDAFLRKCRCKVSLNPVRMTPARYTSRAMRSRRATA